jgi:hypothetical protein
VKKCLVYLRVTGKTQADGDGFAAGLRAVKACAKSHAS